MGLRIAEKNSIAAFRRYQHVNIGEDGAAAGFRLEQIHDQRCDTLAAALEDAGRAGLGGVEIIVMWTILRAGRVAQHLQAFAIGNRPVDEFCDARLDALDHGVLAARKKHALAGAVRMQLFAACSCVHRQRTRQARPGGFHQRVAFCRTEKVGKHHQLGRMVAGNHLNPFVTRIDHGSARIEARRRHRHSSRQAILPNLGVQRHIEFEQFLRRELHHLCRAAGMPAGVQHGFVHRGARAAAGQLRIHPRQHLRCGGLH